MPVDMDDGYLLREGRTGRAAGIPLDRRRAERPACLSGAAARRHKRVKHPAFQPVSETRGAFYERALMVGLPAEYTADRNNALSGAQSGGFSRGSASIRARSRGRLSSIKVLSASIRGISSTSGAAIFIRSSSRTTGRSAGSSWVSARSVKRMGGGVWFSRIQRQASRGRMT